MLSSIGHKRLFPFLLLFLLMVPISRAYALSFNAKWDYQQIGGQGIDTRDQFQERYNLGVGPSFAYKPSRAITASATVGYSRSTQDRGRGMTTSEALSPTARVGLHNDIFLAQLSGSTTTHSRSSGSGSSDQSWDSTLASTWDIPFMPDLKFNHSERTDTTSAEGNRTKNNGVAVRWDLVAAQLYYQYRNSQSEEPRSGSVTENDSHFVRLESNGRFWDNRVNISFAQQAQFTSQNITVGGQSTFILGGQALFKVDDPNTDPAPTDFQYEDPSNTAATVVVNNDQRFNGRFVTGSGFPEQIDGLLLTLDDPFVDLQAAATLRWDLYNRRTTSDPWVLVETGLAGVLDEEDRISITLPNGMEASEVLVVATNNSGQTVTFAGLEAFRLLTQNSSSSTTSYLTNAGISTRLTRTVNTSANLTQEHFGNESGDINSSSDRRTVSANLRWTPFSFVSESASVSENRQMQSGEEDLISRSYSFSVSTIPLKTMRVSLGATHRENYIGDQITQFGNSYSLTTRARLYPDLNGVLSFFYGKSQQLDNNSGFFVGRKSFSSRLDLVAQLTHSLTSELVTRYNRTDNERAINEAGDAELSMTYRPSDLLALNGRYSRDLLGEELKDSLNLGVNLAVLRTQKVRQDLVASYSQAETSGESFNLQGSWLISPNLTFKDDAILTVGTTTIYSFHVSLALAF